MKIFSLTVGRRGSSKARRRAAQLVVDEVLGGAPAQLRPSDSAKLGAELASMRSLAKTLGDLPGQAWSAELGAAPPLGSATTAATSRSAGARRLGPLGGRIRVAPRVGGALAAAALAAAFVVGSLTHPFSQTAHPRGLPLAAARVVMTPLPGAASSSLAVAYMPGGNHMLLHVRNLPRSAPGTYYELWLMTSDTHLVSVTSFRVGASGIGSLRLVLPDDPSNYRYLDISVQHLGSGVAISQDNVLRGALPA